MKFLISVLAITAATATPTFAHSEYCGIICQLWDQLDHEFGDEHSLDDHARMGDGEEDED